MDGFPTHRHIPTGDIIFADAAELHDPADVEMLPAGYWETRRQAEELATKTKRLRERRDALLLASDFVEFSRRLNAGQRAEGLAYRDALFDLPETTDPLDPEWPTPPAWLTLPE